MRVYFMRLFPACTAGAVTVAEVDAMLRKAGFVDIDIRPRDDNREFLQEWQPGKRLDDYVPLANMSARKPKR